MSRRTNKQEYPYWLRNILRLHNSKLMEAGIPPRTLGRLRTGETRVPSFNTLDRLFTLYLDYWNDRLLRNGVTVEQTEYFLKFYTPDKMLNEIKQRRHIAEFISRHKEDGKYHPIKRVLEGMAKSSRVTVQDWQIYIKEKYYP